MFQDTKWRYRRRECGYYGEALVKYNDVALQVLVLSQACFNDYNHIHKSFLFKECVFYPLGASNYY